MAERRYLTIRHACELADVSRRTLYGWMADGKVEWVRTAGGSRRIALDTLFRPATPSPQPPVLPPFPQGPLVHPADRARLEGNR